MARNKHFLPCWAVNAFRNNESRKPGAIAILRYFVTQLSRRQWCATSAALNTAGILPAALRQPVRMQIYIHCYPLLYQILLHTHMQVKHDKILLTLLSHSSFSTHIPSTHRLFFFHSSLLSSSFP